LVSIPQWCDCCSFEAMDSHPDKGSFNPTMVRLLRVRLVLSFGRSTMFQSHNGAIAAAYQIVPSEKLIKVSIPQWCDCCPWLVKIAFKYFVRVSIPQWCDCCTIRTRRIGRKVYGFNPTMVRLLLQINCHERKRSNVSIPQWCDCCGESEPSARWDARVSIPQWCDCCGTSPAVSTG